MRKTIILGITSGIAAYKALDLITLLKEDNIDVFATMTTKTANIISPKELANITGNKVFLELFENTFNYKDVLKNRTVDHIALADKADLMAIVPATANTIAKIANGFADDFLTTTALAITKPLVIAPAMNVHMWNNPTVQKNIDTLKQLHHIIVEPVEGMLACGYEAIGKLEDIQHIKQVISNELEKNTSLHGKKILITAGGTIEKIDNVRHIANRSSGKMGVALAEACFQRGADVLLLRAKSAVKPRYLIPEQIFETSSELADLVKMYVPTYDWIYHTAAVSDFTPVNQTEGKISSDVPITLQLYPQIKIVDMIKKLNNYSKLIAFKAEYNLSDHELIEKAKQKIQQTHADAVIANDISRTDRGFESDMNEVIIVTANGKIKKFPHTSKKDLANQIIDFFASE